jgi:hypothetical protein
MNALNQFAPVFGESFPDQLKPGYLYVSMEFASVAHLCPCGCATEIVTPLSPTDWRLEFDGVGVSLSPSIGNWRLPCRSHYFIHSNRVVWAGSLSDERIEYGRKRDKAAKAAHQQRGPARGNALQPNESTPNHHLPEQVPTPTDRLEPQSGAFSRLAKWLLGAIGLKRD